MYLDDDNQYRYIISRFEEFEKIKDRLIENIEKISVVMVAYLILPQRIMVRIYFRLFKSVCI